MFLTRICLLLLMFVPIECNAQQVFVEAERVGQGILRKFNEECYVFVPEHVLGDPWSPEIVTVGGGKSQFEIVKRYPADIGIGKISGSIQNCSALRTSALDLILGGVPVANIQYVAKSGSTKVYTVSVQHVNEDFFSIKPLDKDFEIHQGMSGSAIFVNGAIVGQLQTVDSVTGVGKVIRLDYMLAASQRYFDAKNPYAQKTSSASPQLVSHTIDPEMIVRGTPEAVIVGPIEKAVSFWWQPQPVMLEVAVFGQGFSLSYRHNLYAANSNKPVRVIISGVVGSNDDWRTINEAEISMWSSRPISIGEVVSGFSRVRIEFHFSKSVREAALGQILFN